LLWRSLRFDHPREHDLLQILGEAHDPPIKFAIIASAIVLAPMFEEMLFRGFLQSATLAALNRWSDSRDRAPRGRTNAATPGWLKWLAIVLASIAFTAVHQHLWLMPPIFVLSLCLGYVYERTNNLWAPITIHALFNAASTALFLITR